MAVNVRIPPLLRKYTGGVNTVRAAGDTVGDVLFYLGRQHPGLSEEILNTDGSLHQFINVYRNGEDIRYLELLSTGLADGDVVAILPAVAGGAALEE